MEEPPKIYKIDFIKLHTALDNKRRTGRGTLSWHRLANRIGHPGSETTLVSLKDVQTSIHSALLANILMWLDKPLSDFVIEVKEEVNTTNANTKKRSTKNSSKS